MLIDSTICFKKTAFTINAIGKNKSCIMNENRTKRQQNNAAERKEKPASEKDQTFELCFLLKYLY